MYALYDFTHEFFQNLSKSFHLNKKPQPFDSNGWYKMHEMDFIAFTFYKNVYKR